MPNFDCTGRKGSTFIVHSLHYQWIVLWDQKNSAEELINDCYVDPQLESGVWTQILQITDELHGPLMVIRGGKAQLLVRLRPERF